ncbi:MAG: trypsin-like peptidase domain-containing protein [Treponema sp.]|nr:trypsin-like peptidase domain-containing protein [Treponema sp.]
MKRLYAYLLVTLVMTFAFTQELKSNVCVVREVYSQETTDWHNQAEVDLVSKGYANYSNYMADYIGNTFGSGFVYISKDGNCYIITNRHVVPKAEFADVEFEQADGTFKKYEKLKVLACDEELDLAILSFPEGEKTFTKSFPISKTPAKDGENIWSAGFPGLGSSAVWQLGNGTITNASVKIPEIINPEITNLIQHSAPVDSGNSGGPLLRKTKDSYEVVGINTWKSFYRQATNISIPASAIDSFITKTLSVKGIDASEEKAKARAEKFLSEIKKEDASFSNIENFVHFDFVKSEGLSKFTSALMKAKTADSDYISKSFINASPIEGMKSAVAYSIFKTFSENDFKDNCSISSVSAVEDQTDTYQIVFSSEDNTLYTNWKIEETSPEGYFRIVYVNDKAFEKNVKKSKKTSKSSSLSFEIDKPRFFGVNAGITPSMNSATNPVCFQAGIDMLFTDFTGFDFTYILDKQDSVPVHTIASDFKFVVPFIFDSIVVMPYATVGAEIYFRDLTKYADSLNGISDIFGFTYSIGVEGGYKFENFYVGAYAAFIMRHSNKSPGVTAGIKIGL